MDTIIVGELRAELDGAMIGTGARDLARRALERVEAEANNAGRGSFADGLDVAWAVDSPGGAPTVVAEFGAEFSLPMRQLAGTSVYAATATWEAGSAVRWRFDLNGERIGGGQAEAYPVHPDSREKMGVARGQLLRQEPWHSHVFAGTVRPWSVYLPAEAREPAAVMVFQDGVRQYEKFVPTVFDNLIAAGAMPPTVGIFLDPGVFADTTVSNRSFEYDTLSGQYTAFLLDEILPEVQRMRSLRSDAAGRAICGISSGGICAFTVAWQRPDQFHKVLSHVGSFTNIASGTTLREGGHNYPFLIRKVPPKPIRIYLQDGENDLNNPHGNWWLANLQMDDALRFAGYDYTFVAGRGFHSLAHGRAIFPDSLRWLWRS
ncbi:MAG: alpha/beta hydrolase-fold protein [Chloroflexota bacterium]